jgi:hypothetical protein
MAIQRYVGDKFTGMSTDAKPSNVIDGATFYETDTLKHFLRVSGVWSEVAGASGYSGYSGESISGYSGYSGWSGIGTSGYSGYSGESISGYSGYSGSGISGYSGYSGSGISGYSGYSGSGISGYSGWSGYSGATTALDWHFASDNTETSTTSATNITKATLTFTAAYTGSYMIQWNCELANSTNNATTAASFYEGATIRNGEFLSKVNVVSSYGTQSGFYVATLTASTSYTFTIQYRAVSGTAFIRNAKIAAWRVS